MNSMMDAAFEENGVEVLSQDGFQTVIGGGRDVFVSENVGECCGEYPKR